VHVELLNRNTYSHILRIYISLSGNAMDIKQ